MQKRCKVVINDVKKISEMEKGPTFISTLSDRQHSDTVLSWDIKRGTMNDNGLTFARVEYLVYLFFFSFG